MIKIEGEILDEVTNFKVEIQAKTSEILNQYSPKITREHQF
jgi:hypothetical protein